MPRAPSGASKPTADTAPAASGRPASDDGGGGVPPRRQSNASAGATPRVRVRLPPPRAQPDPAPAEAGVQAASPDGGGEGGRAGRQPLDRPTTPPLDDWDALCCAVVGPLATPPPPACLASALAPLASTASPAFCGLSPLPGGRLPGSLAAALRPRSASDDGGWPPPGGAAAALRRTRAAALPLSPPWRLVPVASPPPVAAVVSDDGSGAGFDPPSATPADAMEAEAAGLVGAVLRARTPPRAPKRRPPSAARRMEAAARTLAASLGDTHPHVGKAWLLAARAHGAGADGGPAEAALARAYEVCAVNLAAVSGAKPAACSAGVQTVGGVGDPPPPAKRARAA